MKTIKIAVISFLLGGSLQAGVIPYPDVILMNPDRLVEVKGKALDADYAYQEELQALYEQADAVLDAENLYSVTFNEALPPSGDINDYFSLSPYWWPDETKADGLPYIRRDGETNPERDLVSDRKPIEAMIQDVGLLSQAYYFSGNERYAAWAAKMLRTWFLDPETRMNPNLRHGQVIKGLNDGKGGGIIGTRRFVLLVDYIRLLEGSKYWTAADEAAITVWFNDFIDWLLIHPFGHSELGQRNNHGTSYDMQVIALAMFTGRDYLARMLAEEYSLKRLEVQIEPDGKQPLELVRTKGFNYSIENIKYHYRIGLMVEKLGINYFHADPHGGLLKKAMDYLCPFTNDPDAWRAKHMQITDWQSDRITWSLLVANAVYQDPEYQKMIDEMGWAPPPLCDYIYLPTPNFLVN